MSTIYVPICETCEDEAVYYAARTILVRHRVLTDVNEEVPEDGYFDVSPKKAATIIRELLAAGISAKIVETERLR